MVIRNMEVFYFLCQMNVGYVNTYLMSLKCYGAVALVSLLIPEMVSVVIVTASAKAIFWEKFGVDFDYGADLTVSISRNVDLNDDLWFEIENSINVKFKDFKIPQNVYRALLEVYVSFHENDDFLYGNSVNEYISLNNLSVPRNGAFREVIVSLDEMIVGVV
ncbi:Peptide-N4-(N-acetyl-beta-glucosaminyl)asparagine amidase A [Capsicum chinense]|nr:Peptide-N4-(N-acetyl-beta-glucosaminyl)asparagine amidase A [Capsicum chinense]